MIIFFLFLKKHILCDPSLELSPIDGSNEGSQCTFYSKIRDIIPKFSITSSYPEH